MDFLLCHAAEYLDGSLLHCSLVVRLLTNDSPTPATLVTILTCMPSNAQPAAVASQECCHHKSQNTESQNR